MTSPMPNSSSEQRPLPDLALPTYAIKALQLLENAGHEAWVVGGFVRDAVLGRDQYDVDMACSAPWEATALAFREAGFAVIETGTKHGTITARIDGCNIEITSYRSDGTYTDCRHPDSVTLVKTIEEDLARRDFACNAIAYHPARGYVDPYGGLRDIKSGTIRCVGNPMKRFDEDPLRILRGCRFMSQLGFSIEGATFTAMMHRKHLLNRVSAERIAKELDGFLRGAFVHDALMVCVDVLSVPLPELVAMKGFEQRTPYHIYDVLEHTAWALHHAPPTSLARWTALLHDVGKPASFFMDEEGVGHFYGHPKVSHAMGRGVMARLKLPQALANDVLTLVLFHDRQYPETEKAMRRLLASLDGRPEMVRALCDMKRADALSQAPKCFARAEHATALEHILDDVLASNAAFDLKSLAVDGHDAIACGIEPGPLVGEALRATLEAVIEEEVENEKAALRAFLTTWAQEKV